MLLSVTQPLMCLNYSMTLIYSAFGFPIHHVRPRPWDQVMTSLVLEDYIHKWSSEFQHTTLSRVLFMVVKRAKTMNRMVLGV